MITSAARMHTPQTRDGRLASSRLAGFAARASAAIPRDFLGPLAGECRLRPTRTSGTGTCRRSSIYADLCPVGRAPYLQISARL
jgi:hypothetical protein